ncbi:MAG: hypothetical protein OXU53_00510, partial [Deltaproteobacteria bacterium]|nr:hypothetical protein [Deltaproteobacteria bacterium]
MAARGVWLASGGARGQEFTVVSRECTSMTAQCPQGEVFDTAEGSVWRFQARLSAAVNAATSVDYTIVSYGVPGVVAGTSDDDFDSPITGTLSVAANQTTLNFE